MNILQFYLEDLQPYSKSILGLESNLGKIFPFYCKFIRCSTST